ncbi:MAG: hypothetical protein NVSMB5_11370 [Candidatus Velthaea sp.]
MYLKMAWRAFRHAIMRLVARDSVNGYERKIFSQNGEDGILREIFRRIGAPQRYFVEFGVEDGLECNSARLSRTLQWSGLLIEGDAEKFRLLEANYRAFPAIKREQAFITRDNIAAIFTAARVPLEFDLLSIDIDGNDYYIWDALAGAGYRPRIVIIEYNSTRPPAERWVMRYNPDHRWRGDGYWGASLASLEALGRTRGYALIGTDEKGVNAFFVRDDLLALSGFARRSAIDAYHPTGYGFTRTDGPSDPL